MSRSEKVKFASAHQLRRKESDMKNVYCSVCKKKIMSYDNTSAKKYESPLKKCPKCGELYIDPRCHELAAEGMPTSEFSIVSYVILSVFGALIVWRGIYLLDRVQMGVPEETQWIIPVVLMIMGAVFAIGGIVEILLIKTGRKAKKFDRMYEESEERLRSADYVRLLREHGYDVPEDKEKIQ